MTRRISAVLTFLLLATLAGCGTPTVADPNGLDDPNATDPNAADPNAETWTVAPTGSTAHLLQPADLTYRGAFRLPGESGGSTWAWGGYAMAYRPDGDPSGPADGCTGSLYGTGHAQQCYVSEISIPVPVISAAKDVNELNVAETLQPFTDVRAGVGQLEVLQEIIRVGLAYLPRQGDQTADKLYLAWGAHFQEDAQNVASHMWCDTDLTNSHGAWRVGSYSLYSVNDYMFDIPQAWATANVGGRLLATGRYRDGGWSGQGPALFAIAPWTQGNPPAHNTVLEATPLLLYSSTFYEDPTDYKMVGYHNSDEWAGGAWLSAGDRSAVIFAGTKGTGNCWYGLTDGTVWPDEAPYPSDPNNERGWWSTSFVARIIFFNPDDLAAVAAGTMQPREPQPYAYLDLDDRLFHIQRAQQKDHLGAIAFDRDHGLLYVFEPFGDDEQPIVHVWAISG